MIIEDYVSFETAKLLKEKGFDEKCFQYYMIYAKWDGVPFQDYAIEFRRLYSEDEPLINSKGLKCFSEERNKHSVFSAPTLQMAMKWLRKEHGLFIRITEDITGSIFEWSIYQKNYGCRMFTYVEDSYEKACETAIKYCLEDLI
jgi:hypothetical protein